MSDLPRWYSQLRWSSPHPIAVLNRSEIPPGAGIYAFTTNTAPLSKENVLYIGKADGAKQTLRTRLSVYFRHFASNRLTSEHSGLEDLARHYQQNPSRLYVRWAGCIMARDIEGSLIFRFDPIYNHKDEYRFGISDDELIPESMLY